MHKIFGRMVNIFGKMVKIFLCYMAMLIFCVFCLLCSFPVFFSRIFVQTFCWFLFDYSLFKCLEFLLADLFISGLYSGGISHGSKWVGFFFLPRVLGWGSISLYLLTANGDRQLIFFHNSRTSLFSLQWRQTSS